MYSCILILEYSFLILLPYSRWWTEVKSGLMEPRLTFEERKEKGRSILYCIMKGAGIKTEFTTKWYELLNGVNRMVFTEYKNAKTREKNRMQDILKSLRRITRRAEHHCQKLGYPV